VTVLPRSHYPVSPCQIEQTPADRSVRWRVGAREDGELPMNDAQRYRENAAEAN
jgi:hypothetical protein